MKGPLLPILPNKNPLTSFYRKTLEKLPYFQAFGNGNLHFLVRIGTWSTLKGTGEYFVLKTSHFDEILWPVNAVNSN